MKGRAGIVLVVLAVAGAVLPGGNALAYGDSGAEATVARPGDTFEDGALVFRADLRFGLGFSEDLGKSTDRPPIRAGVAAVLDSLFTDRLSVGGFFAAEYYPGDKLGSGFALTLGPRFAEYAPTPSDRVRLVSGLALGYAHLFTATGPDADGAVLSYEFGVVVRLDDSGALLSITTGCQFVFLHTDGEFVHAPLIPGFLGVGRTF